MTGNQIFDGKGPTNALIALLRKDPNITRLRGMGVSRMPRVDSFTEGDLHRLVACVEESNATFEGFALRDWPGRPTQLLGHPVCYLDEVREGEMFGGMWSDVDEKGVPKHSAAFAFMRRGAVANSIRLPDCCAAIKEAVSTDLGTQPLGLVYKSGLWCVPSRDGMILTGLEFCPFCGRPLPQADSVVGETQNG